MKIKKGDSIIVIAGKDRSKTGTVTRAFPKKNMILIDGVNVIKKHQKSRQRGTAGQIIERPTPIHVSNVAIEENKKPVRVGYKIEREGEKATKIRVSRQSGEKI